MPFTPTPDVSNETTKASIFVVPCVLVAITVRYSSWMKNASFGFCGDQPEQHPDTDSPMVDSIRQGFVDSSSY